MGRSQLAVLSILISHRHLLHTLQHVGGELLKSGGNRRLV